MSLRKKLVLAVIGISTLATTVSVGLTFLFDYKKEFDQINKISESIQSQFVKPLTQLAWEFNENQIATQINSLSKIVEISGARFETIDQSWSYQSENFSTDENQIIEKYDLVYDDEGKARPVGVLVITFDRRKIVSKVFDKVLFVIFINFLKSILISSILLFVFQKIVTNKVEDISEFLKQLTDTDFKNRKMKKFNKGWGVFQIPDELSRLRRTIIQMARHTELSYRTYDHQIEKSKELIEMERAKALYASKMASLGEMASGIAHEINNPLAIIEAKVSLMTKNSDLVSEIYKEKFLQDLDKIKVTSQRISRIIRGLRSFARDGSGDPMQWVPFQGLLEETLALVQERISKHNITFTCTKVDFELFCRPVEISQVVVNLINNSIDAIENLPFRWIKLEIDLESVEAKLRVIDSGPGIPEELEEKVMLPFFTTKDVGKGTGLGLSISKGIIENHKGTLKVNRDFSNTCFEIVFTKIRMARRMAQTS